MKSKNKKINRMKRIQELESLIIELENYQIGECNEALKEAFGEIPTLETKEKLIAFSKDNLEIMRNENIDNDKKYLSEIIQEENIQFTSNSLILAPVGSGKTTLIKDILSKDKPGKKILLISNTALKNSLCPEDYKNLESLDLYTTVGERMLSKQKTKTGMHVMSYAEFGSRIKYKNDFLKNVSQIYCDEIHSLPEYQEYNDSVSLSHAIKYLFDSHADKQIFYFTATDENLKKLEKKAPGILDNIKTYNYLNHPEIKQYMVLSEYEIEHINQIRSHLQARLKSFNYFGYKCLAYTRRISGMKKIEEIAKSEGFVPLTLWSINSDEAMTETQLEARNALLTSGEIPEPYNFLIINSAMQEGWDLKDNSVKLAIMNTVNETEKIQSIGRLRGDLDVLICRAKDKEKLHENVRVKQSFLSKPLSADDKKDLCFDTGILGRRGEPIKWNSLKKLLLDQGYEVKDCTKVIDGKQRRVSVITSPLVGWEWFWCE